MLLFTNILQTLGCVICVSAFILTTETSTNTSTNHPPFSLSIQIVSLGSYLAIPISSVALAFRKDPTEGSLLISQLLSGLAIGMGVVPIIAILQNYLDSTLPLFFASGYLTNVPAYICRTVPQMYIWQRKRRGAPVGDWGNLNGIRIDMQDSKRARFILYLVFFGIMASLILTSLALSSPNLIVWFPFVILVSVSLIGLIVYLQGGKSGWQPVILDTYENKIMWWYNAQGSLTFVLLKNPYVAFQDNLVKISLVKGGLPTSLRFHSQADLDHFLATTGLSGPTHY